VTVFVETRERSDDNMPHQTSGKKRGTAGALLSKQKQAKRPRVDAQSDGDTANPRLPKLPRTAQTEKTRPSVSFASNSSRKSVRIGTPSELASSKSKKKKLSAARTASTASASTSSAASALPRAFTVIVGSYEKLLYGIEGTYESNAAGGGGSSKSNISPTLKAVFIFPAHVASVRAVAASPDGGKWLATGSSDEIIKVWDLRRRKEVGGLMQHQGSSISRLFGYAPPRCNCMLTI
jgi:protein MAK11